MKFPFITHPRTGQKDTMLTMAVISTLAAVFKFLANGVTIGTTNLGTIDATLLAALLTPTLGAYWARKHTDKTCEVAEHQHLAQQKQKEQ
jgi:hypothetical protein